MATVKYYLSRYVTKEDQRGEIQLRFSGNRQFVKRAPTGIFITLANWDTERGMPKTRKAIKRGDNCDEIRDRLNQLTLYLLRCWEQTPEGELKDNSLSLWMNDIEWDADREEVFINGKLTEVKSWTVTSKTQQAEEEAAKKREMAKFVNWYFLDAFKHYIDEQYKNGIISEVRHRTYTTC